MRARVLSAAAAAILSSCPAPPSTSDGSNEPPPWRVGEARRAPPGPRGLVDVRGLVHAHSVYSHDACDGEPVKDGVRDEACFDDFRAGLCRAKHDFVFLTDHRDAFDETEFPDALLHRPERGDVLVERDGAPVASFAACEDGSRALVLAGAEAGTMPVGLEGHAAAREARGALYGARDAASIQALKDRGAVVLLAHPEELSLDELRALPLDGFEMFNLHAATMREAGTALELLLRNHEGDPGLLHPDLFVLPLLSEDPRYLSRWSGVLAAGGTPTTTMGTDCHQNTFPALAEDGERVDSYRRMMSWLSNHLLVRAEPDGSWDDRHLKEALSAGRLYGAFEVMGHPIGFDFHASTTAGVTEMGGAVDLAASPRLVARVPRVDGLDPAREPPGITVRVLRAGPDGFEEIASSETDLDLQVTNPGAYRAEVRMTPHHLREELRDDARRVLERDFVWIYSNAIHVR